MRNDTAGQCGGLQTTREDGWGPERRMGRLQANTPRTHGAPGRGVHGRGKGLTTRHSEAVARFQQRARRLHANRTGLGEQAIESPRRPGESVRASGEGPHHRWTASPNRERHASTVGLRSNRPTRGTEWCLREMENRRPPLRTYPLEAATSLGGGVVARGELELLELGGVDGVVTRVGAGVDVVALGAGARLHVVACVECAALECALIGTELVGGLLAL